jgi:crossover junction endodeoxyribonuclease RuvC
MRILGIDPGSRITGYGVIDNSRRGLEAVSFGDLKPPKDAPLSVILITLHNKLVEVIESFSPDAIAIEDIFFGKNVKSLIKQGHVRGVAILAGARGAIPVYEYSPLEIKKAVVGYGRAEKNQMQIMTKALLHLDKLPTPDAADALAAAICHAHFLKGVPI